MKRLALALSIFAGIAFAVSATKFYCDINMQNHKITNLESPSANADAATKQYCDQQASGKLSLSGGTMSGNLAMGPSYSPTAAKHVATKEYVDTKSPSASLGHDAFAFYKNAGQYSSVFEINQTGGMVRAVMLCDNINGTINLSSSVTPAQMSVKRTGVTVSAGSDFGVWFKPSSDTDEAFASIKVSNAQGDYGRFLLKYSRLSRSDWDIWVKGYNMTALKLDEGTSRNVNANGCYYNNMMLVDVGFSNTTSRALSGLSFSVSAEYQTGSGHPVGSYPDGNSGISVPAKSIVWKSFYISGYPTAQDKGLRMIIESVCQGLAEIKQNGTLYVAPIPLP